MRLVSAKKRAVTARSRARVGPPATRLSRAEPGISKAYDQLPVPSFIAPGTPKISNHYWEQREICDLVPDDTLRLTPDDIRHRLPAWRELISA